MKSSEKGRHLKTKRTPLALKRSESIMPRANDINKRRLGSASKCTVDRNHSPRGSYKERWTTLSSLSTGSAHARRLFKCGKTNITRTLSNIRTSVDLFAQKFRRSARRRVILENQRTPSSAEVTPKTRSKLILGRTPTQLYSPFSIETPNYLKQQSRQNSILKNPWNFGYRRSYRVSPQRFQELQLTPRHSLGRMEENGEERGRRTCHSNTRRSLRL